MLQALARGETVSVIARSYDLDRKTVRTWRTRGRYGPRQGAGGRLAARILSGVAARRSPEIGFNALVLTRELRAQGFVGSAIIVRRAVRPLRAAAVPSTATVRFAGVRHDAGILPALLCGRVSAAAAVRVARRHEQAFQRFGGVTNTLLVDNAKAMVLTHTQEATTRHLTYSDFAGYDGFRPWACAPYRLQTKGKVESGVKYVARNALAGKRLHSWAHLNAWLVEWATTIADQRVRAGSTIPAQSGRREPAL